MKANYDLISDDWSKARKVLPPKDMHLFELFIEKLPERANILDLGCGSGIPIAKLLDERGFQITGVDRSSKLLNQAKNNVPSATFHKGEIEDYQIKNTFDAMVLWDTSFHLPRVEHKSIIERIFNALPSHGLLILSSGGSEENLPPFTDFMFGVEFFYDSHPINELLTLCQKIGFNVEKQLLVNVPDGERDKGRIGVVLSKTESVD